MHFSLFWKVEKAYKQNVNSSKRVGKDRAFLGLAVLSSGFPMGFALGKFLGAAMPALGKHNPSLLFYLD